MKYPVEAFSWQVVAADVAVKRMDKSSFLHRGSGIPAEIAFFLGLDRRRLARPRKVTLRNGGKSYRAQLQLDALHARFRLFWGAGFAALIRSTFLGVHSAYASGREPDGTPPAMKFTARSRDDYLVEFIEPGQTSLAMAKNGRSGRNPSWSRDELILALDLYFRHSRLHINKTHPEVIALSDLLNRLPIHPDRPDAERFRNPAGVYMKLCNFLRCDPSYKGKGLTRGSKGDRAVWEEFADDRPRLRQLATAIRETTLSGIALPAVDDAEEDGAPEGKVLTRLHKVRERSRPLVKRKKAKELEQKGCLRCEVCGMDYGEVYDHREAA